jgi:hypothetical protein
MINPVGVSVIGDRLLKRSNTEFQDGDNSLSIILSAIAVETFLAQLFLKVNKMDAKVYGRATADQEQAWEEKYSKFGGFPGKADGVSEATVGMTFDTFTTENSIARKAMESFPDAGSSTKRYFYDQLFKRRNRIVHWGNMNSCLEEAQQGLSVAIAIIQILKQMDKMKYGHL